MKTSNNLSQVEGSHYEDLKIEPVTLMVQLDYNWFQGEILKYVSRFKRKGGNKDLNKALHIASIARDKQPVIYTKRVIDKHPSLSGICIHEYVKQFEDDQTIIETDLFIKYLTDMILALNIGDWSRVIHAIDLIRYAENG